MSEQEEKVEGEQEQDSASKDANVESTEASQPASENDVDKPPNEQRYISSHIYLWKIISCIYATKFGWCIFIQTDCICICV